MVLAYHKPKNGAEGIYSIRIITPFLFLWNSKCLLPQTDIRVVVIRLQNPIILVTPKLQNAKREPQVRNFSAQSAAPLW